MSKLDWEDFRQGSVAEYGPRLVTRDEIIAFATEFDPQPMHLDEAAGRASMLGGLAASGWHICSIMMRIVVDGLLGNASSMGSPGVEEARWLAPLRPGDRVSVRATVLETRASASRRQMGFVKFLLEMFNQEGVQLMKLTTSLMIARRQDPAAE